eukprot:768386-Hanusia_phi.AAC.5
MPLFRSEPLPERAVGVVETGVVSYKVSYELIGKRSDGRNRDAMNGRGPTTPSPSIDPYQWLQALRFAMVGRLLMIPHPLGELGMQTNGELKVRTRQRCLLYPALLCRSHACSTSGLSHINTTSILDMGFRVP